jgi:CoA-transferase family III
VGEPPAIPLSRWADRQLDALAEASGAAAISRLSGAQLLGERAALGGFRVPGPLSAGGGCRLYQARDGWVALSLARPDDRALLPALFGDADIDPDDDAAVAERMAASDAQALVAHGAELGLAIAGENELLPSRAWETTFQGMANKRVAHRPLRVVDLSALWAGPLATHLLHLAGAEVVKVESANRPDAMRDGDAAFFDLLNRGKERIALDLRQADRLNRLIALIRKADIVIEASRPRALLQLGLDAEALVGDVPGLVWMTITGHGVQGDCANRIGFGDDCGVAGGLSAALRQASGHGGFVGDAIADPLTGIATAKLAWEQWGTGQGARIVVSMSGVVALALADERQRHENALEQDLKAWAAARGQPFGIPRTPLC